MANPGTVIVSAVVLCVGPAITCVASTMPWMLEYWGTITAAAVAANATTGQIIGRGRFSCPLTSWTTAPSEFIVPQTVGAQTVQQTASGMNTATTQNVLVGATVTTATGLTSITTNELTCEILG
jgi:hypothetical protein